MFLNTLKKRKVELQIQLMELKVLEQQIAMLPHRNVPVVIVRDGSHWKCIFRSHQDELNCVVAYGDSPAQACSNFDALWEGGLEIEPEEEF